MQKNVLHAWSHILVAQHSFKNASAHAGSILRNPDDLWSPLHCQCFAPCTVAAAPQLLDEQRMAHIRVPV